MGLISIALLLSNRGCINPVIFLVRSNKSNINHAVLIDYDNHQPVMIAFYIEYNAIIREEAGISVHRFDV